MNLAPISHSLNKHADCMPAASCVLFEGSIHPANRLKPRPPIGSMILVVASVMRAKND